MAFENAIINLPSIATASIAIIIGVFLWFYGFARHASVYSKSQDAIYLPRLVGILFGSSRADGVLSIGGMIVQIAAYFPTPAMAFSSLSIISVPTAGILYATMLLFCMPLVVIMFWKSYRHQPNVLTWNWVPQNGKSTSTRKRFAADWRRAGLVITATTGLAIPFFLLFSFLLFSKPATVIFRDWTTNEIVAQILLLVFFLVTLVISILMLFTPLESLLIAFTNQGIIKSSLPFSQFLAWADISDVAVDSSTWRVVLKSKNKRMNLDLSLLKDLQNIVEQIRERISQNKSA